jgi:hypothetical protein
MERRVFGCKEFSDIVFQSSIVILETILEKILKDLVDDNKIYKVGFFSNNQ